VTSTTPTPEQLAEAYPRERASRERTFEIGLVLAGAVSAGAYTAGVLDFLFEALDTWRRAALDDRRAGRTGAEATVPDHNVTIRIVTGASAGGMNGAIAAAALNSAYDYGRPDTTGKVPQGNPFYEAWVRRIDIKDLLATDDLSGSVRSFLNCTALQDIVDRVLTEERPPVDPEVRCWLDNPLQLLLTVTNLRGLPYAVNFHGGDAARHAMTVHRDYVGFAVPGLSTRPRECVPFDLRVLPGDRRDEAWKELGGSALATGAFPLALRPIGLSRPQADYRFRHPFHPEDGPVTFGAPAWPQTDASSPDYDFLCVDGGAMNNEPFDLAHAALAGLYGSNPREGLKAHRAVVMIDPFVDSTRLGPAAEVGLPAAAAALLSAYQDQARYSPQDWALVQSDEVFSRFLIAPARKSVDGAASLASGGLGAFLGFFSEAYRHHDFLLGRRNCQWFLKTFFTLPAGNPLFGKWRMREEYRDAQDPEFRQIIPCVGPCEREEIMPQWPDRGPDLGALEDLIKARVQAVTRQLIRDATDGLGPWQRPFVRSYLAVGRAIGQGTLDRAILGRVSDAVREVASGPPESRSPP
jgi:hypothetical protein